MKKMLTDKFITDELCHYFCRMPGYKFGFYMEIYFDRYPKIKGYLESVKEEAKEKGYVLTVLNRRRFIPEIKSGI